MAVLFNMKENSQKFHVAIIFGPKLYTLSIFTVKRESKNWNSWLLQRLLYMLIKAVSHLYMSVFLKGYRTVLFWCTAFRR